VRPALLPALATLPEMVNNLVMLAARKQAPAIEDKAKILSFNLTAP
jgi:hypothetical protein